MTGAPAGAGEPPPASARSAHMAVRVVRTALEAGIEEEAVVGLERVHALAMAPRERPPVEAEGPDHLHPGRSALILLGDVGEVRPVVLAAGLLAESERAELRVSPERVAAEVGEAVASLLASLPMPGDEDLAERLVLLPEEGRRVALAERLDHLRHAHLWGAPERRREAHAGAVGVYLPVAERTHPTLARRYRWWCGMFGRRWLG